MKYADLNVIVDSETVLGKQIEMGSKLGYSVFAISGSAIEDIPSDSPINLYTRIDLKQQKLSSLKRKARKVRNQYLISTINLGGVDAANWAAEDDMIDILTLSSSSNSKLRQTTANLAASNGTVLEIPINPLLLTRGLVRSRIIKTMRDAINTALHSGMKVIMTSGAEVPIHLRSPRALIHIGIALGLDEKTASSAISEIPLTILERSLKRFDEKHILPGLEIRGDDL